MTRWLLTAHHRSWLLLVCATVGAVWIREDGLTGVTIGAAILAIAYAKGRLVVLDFMELRHAPLLWRFLLEAWLLLVSSLMLAIYARGIA